MAATIDQSQLTPLKPSDLSIIAGLSADTCVSILMPTHRSGRQTLQGHIRFKNLLKVAHEKLTESGQDASLLDPLSPLARSIEFWQHQGEGLAIFLSPNDCHLFRLERPVNEWVSVGRSFFIQPLIGEQNIGEDYFVLALSWEEAKLFRADGQSLTLVETTTLPAKFDELILPRDPEEILQNTSHRSGSNAVDSSTTMFHGHGEGEEKIEADRSHYLSLVGDEVAAVIYSTGLPLVVAATGEVIGHFEATTKVHVDARVEGSPAEWTVDELRDHAHEAIKAELKPDHNQFSERFGTALAHAHASDDLEEVLAAAKNGRVDALMVCHHDEHCGKTNQAVIDTLRNGGEVSQCSPDAMPGGAFIAAIYRY